MIRTGVDARRQIHEVACRVWQGSEQTGWPDTPDTQKALVQYVTSVEPAFNSLSALIGRMALFLMLSSDERGDLSQTGSVTNNLARAALRETERQLSDLFVPEAATQHHWILQKVMHNLDEILWNWTDVPGLHNSEPDASHLKLTRSLRNAHDMLLSATIPSADLTTLDFAQACCSCGHRKSMKASHAQL